MAESTVLVMAKAPLAGAVKTRLTPTYAPEEAAAIAEAALVDTLDAVRACGATNRVVALAGAVGPWIGEGIDVVAQSEGSFNDRLESAWRHIRGPAIQIGMDTPQVTALQLDHALARVAAPDVDAVLGLAVDGGWWAIGFPQPIPGAFAGVPMSRSDTGVCQLARLGQLGLRVALLPELVDLDEPADLATIAAAAPQLRVARLAAELGVRQ